ncbi:hypothetical protein [Enterobacter cloacae complex sp. ESBL7]|uniref:hypothetical protein n=1 Tax=Enterobacter cloacae complex sp. ESBL7 TaxID=3163325 RepID=UPI0035640A78
MSKSSKELYTVPDWMRQYLPLFHNTGGNDVEELLHDDNTSMFANSIRYMLIVSARSQFTLLMDLHQRGFLSAVSDASLAEVRAQGVEMFAQFILRDACGDRESQRDIGEVLGAAKYFAAQLRQEGK